MKSFKNVHELQYFLHLQASRNDNACFSDLYKLVCSENMLKYAFKEIKAKEKLSHGLVILWPRQAISTVMESPPKAMILLPGTVSINSLSNPLPTVGDTMYTQHRSA